MYRTKITHTDIIIDPELEKLLCPLSEDEFKALEDSIFADGLQDALKVWVNPEDSKCYLVDGHNRYTIMDKHGKEIPQDKIAVLDNERYQTKDDIIFYMLQYQLGRRNLTEGQRIEYVLRYEEYFKKKGKHNQSFGGGDKKSVSPNLGKAVPQEEKIDTNAELAKMAGMSTEKFRQGKVVLKSDNEAVKGKYKRDEISTNRAYKEVTGKNRTKKCLKCKQIKHISKFDGNNDFCNECIKSIYTPTEGRKQVDENSDELTKFLKTERQAKDYTTSSIELKAVFDGIMSSIEYANRKIFEDELDISESMTLDNILFSVERIEENKSTLSNLENKIINLGKVYPKTVADYDKEIADIESKIAALYEMKTKAIQNRHNIADNSELRCECSREYGRVFFNISYTFYLVKGEEKIKLFTMSDSDFSENLFKKIDGKFITYSWKKENPILSEVEKKFITAEIVGMRDQVNKEVDEYLEKILEEQQRRAFNGNGGQSITSAQSNLSDDQKALLKPIFKKLSLEYHPDTNNNENATEIMQTINQLREVIGL